MMRNLDKFFNPQKIAVIGASNDQNKVGYSLVKNLLDGQGRNIYPVTLSEKEILGLPAFASVLDVPDQIDLALIAIRADAVPEALADCGLKGIKNVIVVSSGFKEAGPKGEELENKITEVAREYDISLLGPNCLGVINAQNNLNASFSNQKPLPGKIAFLSQSGALGAGLVDWANGQGVGLSKLVSLGNEADLTEIEFLEYLENDPDTSAVFMYLENVKDGTKFMETLSRITRKKPVVVIKAGMGSHGNLAVRSHTGALAPEPEVFVAACKQAGAVTVSSLRAFFHLVKTLPQVWDASSPVQRLIILTNGGGPSVVAADLIDRSCSLSLSVLPEETKEKLREVLPPMAAIGNPVDILGDALAERYDRALEILVKDENTDGVLVIITPQMMTEMKETAEVLAKYKSLKKIFPILPGGSSMHEAREELIRRGMTYFTFPRDVVESLDYLARGAAKIKSPYGHHGETAAPVVREMIEYGEVFNLLSQYGLNVSGKFLQRKEDLAGALRECGEGPYAMKAFAKFLVHKTETGAVRLNIKNLEEAETVWEELWQNPSADGQLDGILVQKMEKGREVIIGMKRDNTFGPALVFGLGGVLAEAIKDTSVRIAPIGKAEALQMMREIKGLKILEGLRGEPPVNFDLLADIVVGLSRLSLEHPEIKEIDLNPVMATDTSATIVDARVMV